MAGTKEKPCDTCKWGDAAAYLAITGDPCFYCLKGSGHTAKEASNHENKS